MQSNSRCHNKKDENNKDTKSRDRRKRKRKQTIISPSNNNTIESMVPTLANVMDSSNNNTNLKRKKNQEQNDDDEEDDERDIDVLFYSKHVTYVNGSESVESTSVRALITKPRNQDETCSITLDPIHEEAEIHGFKIQYSLMQKYPRHTCIQLPCNHRFNGMALLIHYIRNTMTCPMCRAGVHESIDFIRTFPNEPWHEIMLNIAHPHNNSSDQTLDEAFPGMAPITLQNQFWAILNSNHSTNNNNNEANNIRNIARLQPQSASLLLNLEEINSTITTNDHGVGVDLRDGPVFPTTTSNTGSIVTNFTAFAVFYLFRTPFSNHEEEYENNNEDSIAISLNTSLQLSNETTQTQQPSYTVPPSFATRLATAIQNYRAQSISAKFIIRSRVNASRMQVLTMPRITVPSSLPATLSANIAPPIHAIHIPIPQVTVNAADGDSDDDHHMSSPNPPSSRLDRLRMTAEDIRNHIETDIITMHLVDVSFIPDRNNNVSTTTTSRFAISRQRL